MIARMRRAIALFVGLAVLVFTLGRVKVNLKGDLTSTEGADQPSISSKK